MVSADHQDAIGIPRIDAEAAHAIVAIAVGQVAMHHDPVLPAIIGTEVSGDVDIGVHAHRIGGEDDILDEAATTDHG